MIQTELAWCAGFIDGEGNTNRYKGDKYKDKQYYTVVLMATQADRKPLERLQINLGGIIYGPYLRENPKHQPIYRWAVRKLPDIKLIAKVLWPYLSKHTKEKLFKTLGKEGNQMLDEFEISNGSEWFTQTKEVIAFGRYLIETTSITTADDMLRYFERPWEYTSEYETWKNAANTKEQESLTAQV